MNASASCHVSQSYYAGKYPNYGCWSALIAALLLLAAVPGCQAENRVVIYCAQDEVFAEEIFNDFQRSSSIRAVASYDNEANKAVGLFDDLIREARKPRCDVHWNNEIIATIRLQRRGVLDRYSSPAAKDYPAAFKAADDTWTAFAARARVLIVNTKLLAERGILESEWPTSLTDLNHPRWKGQFAMSQPLAGTSATQAACLFQAWGPEKAKEWYRGLKANGLQLVAGNKQVAEGVAQGQFLVGLTDTDDAAVELAAGRPVKIIFPDKDATAESKLGVLFIPNTVAIIKGCPNLEGARKLVDYLLSTEVEERLAASASRQIPLSPKAKPKLPEWMVTPATARALPVNFEKAADYWDEAQNFVRDELLPR